MRKHRIVSLVPSITETLFALGLDEEIVGVTVSCRRPTEKVSGKAKVGNTKTLNLKTIFSLKPDLVIANQEENEKEQIEALMAEGVTVWLTFPKSIADVLDFISELPERAGAEREKTRALLQKIISAYRFCQLRRSSETLKAACCIWKNPFMSANRFTYIHHLMEAAGASNVYAGAEARYPETSKEELERLAPHVLLLPTEPYPFGEKDAEEITNLSPTLPAVRQKRVHVVDGENLCWFGARTPQGLKMLYRIFHPDARWGFAY